jgi:hypothetical protein
MVTVLVLIGVAILRTNRSPLKGPAGITTLPACPRDLRSATVTRLYSAAGLKMSRVLHAPRQLGAQLAELNGVSEA